MIRKSLIALSLALALVGAAPPAKAQGRLGIELNKLEPIEGGCRAYLVLENRTGSSFSTFTLDLVVFGQDGVITNRLAVEGAPISVDKTLVRLFDLSGLGCGDIGRIVVNDVLACRTDAGERGDCIDLVDVSSRAATDLIK